MDNRHGLGFVLSRIKILFPVFGKYFIGMYENGKVIPPILVHKLPNGKYVVIDGHARVEAYRRLGVKEILAVENSMTTDMSEA
jgi:hypothetical protein